MQMLFVTTRVPYHTSFLLLMRFVFLPRFRTLLAIRSFGQSFILLFAGFRTWTSICTVWFVALPSAFPLAAALLSYPNTYTITGQGQVSCQNVTCSDILGFRLHFSFALLLLLRLQRFSFSSRHATVPVSARMPCTAATNVMHTVWRRTYGRSTGVRTEVRGGKAIAASVASAAGAATAVAPAASENRFSNASYFPLAVPSSCSWSFYIILNLGAEGRQLQNAKTGAWCWIRVRNPNRNAAFTGYCKDLTAVGRGSDEQSDVIKSNVLYAFVRLRLSMHAAHR